MAGPNRSYGLSQPLVSVFPAPVSAQRSPAATDINYEVGQVWVREDTNQVWFLTSVSQGSATWALSSPGASDVDTINSLSPAAGNIVIDGGTNITDVNGGSTVTLNLDDAITLATSVSAPLYTVAAATDLAITAATGQDVVIKMGDNAAANKVSFIDSDDAEVASIDSNGGFSMGAITFSGLLTASASATVDTAGTALTLAADNSGDAVILGGGTAARAITIGQDAAAHTVAIGQAAAGAITLDSAAGISLDAAQASNVTVTGAGQDLTLSSAGGRVDVLATEDTAQAVYIRANGGVSETIQLHADQGTAVNSINLLSDDGGITLTATNLASADAINLEATAGGVDVDGALQVNIASSQNAASALVLASSDGGIDITAAGTGGLDIDMTNAAGSINIVASENATDAVKIESTAGGIDILASGAAAGEDIDIVATGSSVNITSTEADAAAIVLNASDAAGGIDITTGGGDLDIGGAGQVNIESSAGTLNMGADAVAQDINIGTGAAARTVTVGNTTGASGLVLQAGTGEITMTGTVKEIDAKFLYSSGTDLVVSQSPVLQSNATTGAAPTGATGDVNLMYMQDGCIMEQFILGAGSTIIAPRMTANGLDLSLDATNNEGAEFNFGARNNAKHAYTIGTSAAFFMLATIYIEDLSGCDPMFIGFRKVQANDADYTNYTDFYAIGLNNTTSATNVVLARQLNNGGVLLQDSTDAWGGDGTAVQLGVYVSAAGVTTATIAGGAPSAPLAFTFDNGDVIMPFIHFLQDADVTSEVGLQNLKIGFQA